MSRPIVTDDTTLGELQTILTDLEIEQVGMSVRCGNWAVILRRDDVVVATSSKTSLYSAIDDAIAEDVSTDTTVQ